MAQESLRKRCRRNVKPSAAKIPSKTSRQGELLDRNHAEDFSPAAIAVLFTAELLESVLLSVNSKTLLHSKRVCKKFSEVIDKSLWLQKKLFYQEVASLEEALYLADGEDFKEVLLYGPMNVDEDLPHTRVMLNPLIFREEYVPWYGSRCYITTHARSGSSCLQMLLTNRKIEPIGSLDLMINYGTWDGTGESAGHGQTLYQALVDVSEGNYDTMIWEGKTLTIMGNIVETVSEYLEEKKSKDDGGGQSDSSDSSADEGSIWEASSDDGSGED